MEMWSDSQPKDLSKGQCFECKEFGHVVSHCRKKNSCVYCKQAGHIVTECSEVPQKAAADVLSDGSSIDAPSQNDCGFNSIEKKQIIVANGEKMDIIGSDNISLSITPYTPFHLSNVFLVHKLATNLIFVGQLMDDDNIVSFSRDGCMIQDRRTGKMKGKGRRIGRLFALEFEKPGSYSSFFAPSDSNFSFSSKTWHMWHHRLGHPSPQKLEALFSSRLLTTKPVSLSNTILVSMCLVVSASPAHERTKFSKQAVMCVFVGYSADQKGFLCYDPLIRRVRISRHVPLWLEASTKAWFECFQNVILDAGYTQSPHDYSLFTHHTSRGVTLLLLYVDGILITGNDVEGIGELKQLLCQSFQMKDLGPLTYFLGLQVQHCSCGYTVNQRKYTMDLIKCANLTDQKCIDTPMEPNHKLYKDAGERLSDPIHYRQLVGRLVYLTMTQPDFSYAVNTISQFVSDPRRLHLAAVHRIIHYLRGTLSRGLFFSSHSSLDVRAYADADWAGCLNTRRSDLETKQNTVSKSSTEAEYRATSLACSEIISWLRGLLQDLHINLVTPTPLYADNTSAIRIASNPVFHERTKHIEVDCHFIRDKYLDGMISLPRVASQDQIADIFTKPITQARHDYLVDKLLLSNPPHHRMFRFINSSTSRSCNYQMKQNTVSKSSTEAEYRATSSACSEISWLRGLLQDLHINLVTPTPLYADNTSAIRIASNPVFHERTKHIEVDCHFIRDKYLDGMISLPCVASQDQIADIFTKPVTQARHDYSVDKLLLSNPPQFEGE
ncbi:hypothetical protein RJ639_002006 [Escallonia herrerae]|uniref:CCHC-type domain-containing protein n=1 Tax=Escallonia herrerae TaxID=1293975 RepID=A0AA89BNP5_9ASTE|nr:hypothetical protein RJ639_002006 [Escallonia herrerae]